MAPETVQHGGGSEARSGRRRRDEMVDHEGTDGSGRHGAVERGQYREVRHNRLFSEDARIDVRGRQEADDKTATPSCLGQTKEPCRSQWRGAQCSLKDLRRGGRLRVWRRGGSCTPLRSLPRSLHEAASVGPTTIVLDWFHLFTRIRHAAQGVNSSLPLERWTGRSVPPHSVSFPPSGRPQ